jgi:hypothetical protein
VAASIIYRRISGLLYRLILVFMGFISPLLAAIAMPIFSSILLLISYNAFI